MLRMQIGDLSFNIDLIFLTHGFFMSLFIKEYPLLIAFYVWSRVVVTILLPLPPPSTLHALNAEF